MQELNNNHIKSVELASELKGFVEANYEDVFFNDSNIEKK